MGMSPLLLPDAHPPLKNALAEFRTSILDACMRADTSACPDEWSPQNPARGQCAVVACLVQDAFGGNIVNCTATTPDGKTESHYLNEIDGHLADLTRDQFPDNTVFSLPVAKARDFATTRDYVLSVATTDARYRTLHTRASYAKSIHDSKKLGGLAHE